MKRKFDLNEHKEVGAELGSIRNKLVSLSVKVANAYSKSKVGDLNRAIKCIDSVRSDLDELLSEEIPELDNHTFENIYYGDLSGTRKD